MSFPTPVSSSRVIGEEANTTSKTTLSKRTVYLPLAAYDYKVNDKCDPEAYMASRKSLPNSVRESALTEFWHRIGVDYHHRSLTTKGSRNNGSRPVSKSAMEENIRSKAMTLIGGGIHTAWDKTSSSSATKPAAVAATAPKQQLSRKQQLAHKRRRQSKHLMHFATIDEDGNIGRFLYDLNALWNDYIVQLLQLPPQGITEKSQKLDYALWSRVTSCITNETAQLVGARVKIQACQQRPSYKGRIGYVVGKTKNTWNIMVQASNDKNPKKKRRRDDKSVKEESVNSSSNGKAKKEEAKSSGWKALVVPKKDSVLSLLIPMDILQDEGDTKKSKSKKGDPNGPPEATVPILAIDIREDK